MSAYLVVFLCLLALLIGVYWYIYSRRSVIDEMQGMMLGMTMGMLSGLITATLYLIPTGDFLGGFIGGTLVGLVFGVTLGVLGGPLGVMEGVLAGSMGGMMGAMLGQMIRPFSIAVFMPFFVGLVVVTLAGLTWSVFCPCCDDSRRWAFPRSFVPAWLVILVVMLGVTFSLSFKVGSSAPVEIASSSRGLVLPPALANIATSVEASAVINGSWQETTLRIEASRYTPNLIRAKAGIPLRLLVSADETAGCTAEIVFPSLGIDKIIPAGTSAILDIPALSAGWYPFRCSMDMVHGKLIVE